VDADADFDSKGDWVGSGWTGGVDPMTTLKVYMRNMETRCGVKDSEAEH
jgi:hypothetical protein